MPIVMAAYLLISLAPAPPTSSLIKEVEIKGEKYLIIEEPTIPTQEYVQKTAKCKDSLVSVGFQTKHGNEGLYFRLDQNSTSAGEVKKITDSLGKSQIKDIIINRCAGDGDEFSVRVFVFHSTPGQPRERLVLLLTPAGVELRDW